MASTRAKSMAKTASRTSTTAVALLAVATGAAAQAFTAGDANCLRRGEPFGRARSRLPMAAPPPPFRTAAFGFVDLTDDGEVDNKEWPVDTRADAAGGARGAVGGVESDGVAMEARAEIDGRPGGEIVGAPAGGPAVDEDAALAEAQREAADAVALFKRAEEEVARWESELRDIEEGAAAEAEAETKVPGAEALREKTPRITKEGKAALYEHFEGAKWPRNKILPRADTDPALDAILVRFGLQRDQTSRQLRNWNREKFVEEGDKDAIADESNGVDETTVVDGTPPPERISAAAGPLPPTPPLAPPTGRNVLNNDGGADDKLSRINHRLRTTLYGQRKDLGGLRKKINSLEGELLQARRAGREEAKEEENAKIESARARYKLRLAEAEETIAALEARGEALGQELEEGKAELAVALEARDGEAVERGRLVRSYAELEGSVESRAADWSAELDESRRQITSLETSLRETTTSMTRFRTEARDWKRECAGKASQLDASASRVADMRDVLSGLQTKVSEDADRIRGDAGRKGYERSEKDLGTLGDEYELLLRKKSAKINKLRTALRSANSNKRRAERKSEREKKRALSELRGELAGEIDGLRGALEEGADAARGERERLLAEIVSLTESVEELRKELEGNAELYEDCIRSYEEEAAAKDERIRSLEAELNAAEQKILLLESRMEALAAELARERELNAGLAATASELRGELELARVNADGYDGIVAILREEAETYRTQLSEARGETRSYRRKKIDLEELISRTRDSLVDEKRRVHEALEEKDVRIACLDREVADRMNDAHISEAARRKTTSRLKKMTRKRNGEKGRADALDSKIQKLNHLSARANDAEPSKGELDRLTRLLEDVSDSNEEYKSLLTTYRDKSEFLSRQLLLSGQSMSDKQSRIADLREEVTSAAARAAAAAEDKRSADGEASQLRSKLDEVRSESAVRKERANGMIFELTDRLRERDASAFELQETIDGLSEERERSGGGADEATGKEIARLKLAVDDAQLKAKEEMEGKDRSLREMEDAVASLTAATGDLRGERDGVAERLEEELRRGEADHRGHERRLRETEDRLVGEHVAAMTGAEEGAAEATRELEAEIRSLKLKGKRAAAETGGASAAGGAADDGDRARVREMEEALRLSREKEVSLINQNMRMQTRLQGLRPAGPPSSAMSDAAERDDADDDEEGGKPMELPAYYKETRGPVVRRFVGNAWKRLRFRRKKNKLL